MNPSLVIELPLHTVSEANDETYWRNRQRRAKGQRGATALLLRAHRVPTIPCVVRLTRIAPRTLDAGDNASSFAKHIRDEIAAWLGVNDRDSRVGWVYGQERGKVRQYAVRLEVFEGARARTIIEPAYAPDPHKEIF